MHKLGIAFAPRNPLVSGSAGDLPPALLQPPGSAATRDAIPWLQGGICAAVLSAALVLTRDVSPLNPDTPSYLYFDPSRTIGYPTFLWLVKLVTGHAMAAVPAQMALLAASFFVLGWAFHDLVGRPKLSLTFQLLLVASPDLWRFSAQLMTEALATASVALWCAQLLRLINRPSRAGHLSLALVAAAGMLIRPSLVVLFAGTAIAAILLRTARDRQFAFLSLFPIGFMAWLITPVVLLFVHGSAVTTSPLARGMLQHTLFCGGFGASSDRDAALVDQAASTARQYIDAAPNRVQDGLEHLYSAPLRFGLIIPALGRLHHLDAGWQTDPIIARIATQRIEASPICYVQSVLRNYWGLATQASLHVGASGALVDQFLASHPPAPVLSEPLLPTDELALKRAAAELHVAPPTQHPGIGRFEAKSSPFLLLLGRLLYGTAAAVGLLSLAVLLSGHATGARGERYIFCLAAMGMAFHALCAGTAVAELALIRYTIPAWPIVCALLVLAFATLGVRNWTAHPEEQPDAC